MGIQGSQKKPTFREMLADGSFVPLPEILAKTLPFIVAAARAFDGTSPSRAVAVREAVVLAAVAGDGNPNERPGELTWVQNGAIGGGCVDPKVSSACPQHFPPQTLIPTPPAVHDNKAECASCTHHDDDGDDAHYVHGVLRRVRG